LNFIYKELIYIYIYIRVNIVILPDEDFDEVVQADLQVLKQVWAAMEKGEKPFTPFISKSQKMKRQSVRSVGQPYNTRSRVDTFHMSQ
jgi:hypothetical protein